MKLKYLILLICGAWAFASCSSADDEGGLSVMSDFYDFTQGTNGWEVDFVNYPVPKSPEDSTRYNLTSEYTTLPTNLGNKNGIKVSGTNVDGRLFMYMRKKIGGFQANTDYTLGIQVELASSAQATLAEATNVLVKAGAFYQEPKKVIENNNYALNIETGNINTSSGGLVSLGNIGTTTAGNQYSDKYSLITLTSSSLTTPYHIRSNSQGEIWLIIGTDSSYSGTTTVYYTRVSYLLSASN